MAKDYNSDRYYHDNFDYESAREDLFDAGLDPDYLSSRNREERYNYMRKNGFDPHHYDSITSLIFVIFVSTFCGLEFMK